ncbi:MAG TPA: hypothetical protein VMV84_07935 [Dehalococcoidales bacterium]|nr:hypothetical protein [Dehalococcoidales bacterium]
MSVTYDDKNRQAIPRCLEYSMACSLGLLRVIRKQEQIQKTGLQDSNARQEWLDRPSIATAVDFVAEALIIKDFESDEAIKAANYILNNTKPSHFLIRQLVGHFLEKPSLGWIEPSHMQNVNESREDIARLKKSVRMYSVNPIAWSDSSLHYATLGQVDKAKTAMKVALYLGNNNRFILRSASRCFMHLGEPDRAIAILNRSGRCAIDPWIASAEIAIAERTGLKSRSISKARDLIKNENLTPLSKSELAISLGTLEMKGGSVKHAKKFMKQALINPTENALAQAEWMVNQLKIDVDAMVQLRSIVPASYEATAVYEYYRKEFAESLEASKKWGRFQFLSSRPIILSMFLSSCVFNDDLGAINIFKNAFPAQSKDALAINNYVFALARSGHIVEAEKELEKADLEEASREDRLAISATKGLICFRKGYIEEGRKLYNDVIMGFERLRNFRSAVRATYFWAIEEKRIKSQNVEAKIREAKSGIERYNVFELEDLAKKL